MDDQHETLVGAKITYYYAVWVVQIENHLEASAGFIKNSGKGLIQVKVVDALGGCTSFASGQRHFKQCGK
jgi:hypothetical protein